MNSAMGIVSNEWQLQEAKNKFSQLVKAADEGVPQFITVRGKQTAVILSAAEYKKLIRPSVPQSSTLLMPILDDDE
ncbi:MAG: prevent-host-death protein [Phormidesmis priestleyi]|uniref:Antitoxin n=1 Tax=Phormidesmis priestleyi TaxID=268141 RepID=A0A2W4ZUH7_9CYAN|nr:MAG: prevent-host-death protein [Phormidesmis priestleyi]